MKVETVTVDAKKAAAWGRKKIKFIVDKVAWVVYNNTCVVKQRFESCG